MMLDTEQQHHLEPPWVLDSDSPAIFTVDGGGDSDDENEDEEPTGASRPLPYDDGGTAQDQQQQQPRNDDDDDDDEVITSAAAYFFGKETMPTMLSLENMSAVTASLAATTDLALDAAADCDAVLDLQESFVSCIEGVNLQHDYDLEQDYTRDYYPNPSPTSATETATCFLTSNEAASLILQKSMEQQPDRRNNNNTDGSDADAVDSSSNNIILHCPAADSSTAPTIISLRDLDILNICTSIDSGDEVMMEQLLPAAESATNVKERTTAAVAVAATSPPPPTISGTTSCPASVVAASLSSSRNNSPSPLPPDVLPESSLSLSYSMTSQNYDTSDTQYGEEDAAATAGGGATYDAMSSFLVCVSAEEGTATAAAGSCLVACSKPNNETRHNDSEQEVALIHVANDKQAQQQQEQEQESSSSFSQVPLYHDPTTTTADMTGCVIL
jgi:hypothetical protein